MDQRKKQKPRVITPGLVALNQSNADLVRQTNFMVTRFETDVNLYLLSGRAEGGRVELQWLMSHSLV